jgi:hypothetical protein
MLLPCAPTDTKTLSFKTKSSTPFATKAACPTPDTGCMLTPVLRRADFSLAKSLAVELANLNRRHLAPCTPVAAEFAGTGTRSHHEMRCGRHDRSGFLSTQGGAHLCRGGTYDLSNRGRHSGRGPRRTSITTVPAASQCQRHEPHPRGHSQRTREAALAATCWVNIHRTGIVTAVWPPPQTYCPVGSADGHAVAPLQLLCNQVADLVTGIATVHPLSSRIGSDSDVQSHLPCRPPIGMLLA